MEEPRTKKIAADTEEMSPTNKYDFVDNSHSTRVLEALEELRSKNLFTDVVLLVEGREFPCHRAVLSCCDYFKAMFLFESKQTIPIKGVSADIVELIISYLYTSNVVITENNAQSLLETANLFQVHSLRDACCSFLDKQLHPSNCLGIQYFAHTLNCYDLRDKAYNFLLNNFLEVSQYDEFFDLNKEALIEMIENDNLFVKNEEEVYEAALRWINSDSRRERWLYEVLEKVRLPLMSPRYYMEKVETNPAIKKNKECESFLQEVRRYHMLPPDNQQELCSPRIIPRYSLFSEVIIFVGGEHGENTLTEVMCYNPVTDKWNSLSPVPPYDDVGYISVTTCCNNIFLTAIQGKAWIFSPHLNKWSETATEMRSRYRHASIAMDNFVYVIGGASREDRKVSHVERYNIATNKWEEVAPMREALASPAVTTFGGKIYVFGGDNDHSNDVTTVQCFDPQTNEWKLRAPMPIPRSLFSAVVCNGLIYMVGNSTLVHAYNPNNNLWSLAPPLKNYRICCGVTVCNGRIYIAGGRSEENEYISTIECFNPRKQEWEIVKTNLPYKVYHHTCVASLKRFALA